MNLTQLQLKICSGFRISQSAKRRLAWLSIIGLVDFIIISLYQLKVVKRLPDLSYEIFDSNYVNASKEAQILGIPDGPVSAGVYLLILLLSTTKKSGILTKLILVGAITGNAAGAAQYLYIMLFRQKKICLYCITGAIINFIMLGIILRHQKSKRHV